VTKPRAGSLLVAAFGSAKSQPKVDQGWVSRCYGQCQSAPVATIAAEGYGAQAFATLIVPAVPWGPTRAVEAISLGSLGGDGWGSAQGPDRLGRRTGIRHCEGGFSIVSGNSLDIVLVGDYGSRLSSKSLSALGETAWVRLVDGGPARAGLIRGRALEIKGHLGFISETTATYCSIEFQKGCVEVTVSGTNRFDLAFQRPADRVVVNGAGFDLNRRVRSVLVEDDGSGWQLRRPQFGRI